MPAVQSGKILLTGANGYIAVWIIKNYLEAGYAVRGTVRSEKSIPHLKKLFGSYGDKFEVVIVPDMTVDGAFDEFVKDVDAVAHTASPFHFNIVEPSELIEPAVRGTTTILNSVLKHGKNVKRVVVTSSSTAIMEVIADKYIVYTEENWNEKSYPNSVRFGKDAHPYDKYFASKTQAEHAVWEFQEKNKSEMKFDITTINPPLVFGPFLHEVSSPENLNTSMANIYNAVIKRNLTPEQLVQHESAWVDVRNVAQGHLRALQVEEAASQRVLIHYDVFTWQDWVSAAHKFDPSLDAGVTDYKPESVQHPFRIDNSKSKRLYGIEYIGFDECIKDILTQFKELGWY